MAQRRTRAPGQVTDGAYQHLWDKAERDYELWRDSIHGANGARDPRQSRLDDFRAGRPVVASSGEIPPSLGGTELPPPAQRLPFEEELRRHRLHRTVTVHADDRIVDGGEPDWREFTEL